MSKFEFPGYVSFAAVAAVLCFTSSAFAQGNQQQGETVKFSVKAGIEYTDNNESDPDPIAEDNISYSISPRVDVYLNGERTLTDFYYQPSLLYRSDPSDIQNDEDIYHILGVALDHKLSRQTTLRLREEFIISDDPEIGEGGSVRRDQTHFVNRFSVGAKQEITRNLDVDLRANYNIKRFDEDLVADESDEDRKGLELSFLRTLGKKSGITARVGYQETEFKSSTFNIKRGSEVIVLAAGGEHAVNETLRFGANVGIDLVEHEDEGLGSETEPYFDGNVTLSPTPAVRIKGTLAHGVRDADVFPFSTQTFTEFRGKADIDASELLSFGGKAIYRQSEYDEDDLPSSASPAQLFSNASGDETTTVLSAHADYKLGGGSKVRVTQVYEDVDTDVEVSFTKNTSKVEFIVDF